jgi:hypothetical protein
MHTKSDHLKSAVLVFATLAGLSGQLSAAPVAREEPQLAGDAAQEHSRQAALETAASIDSESQAQARSQSLGLASPEAPRRPEPAPVATAQAAPKTAAAQPGAPAATNLATDIHNSVKEGVRPVYEQLVETGAVDAWHELKADLGLDKNRWGKDGDGDTPAKPPGQWDPAGQDPAQPPKTVAQVQMERELATHMREKLVDQLTPWAIGLLVLYGLGHLGKILYDYLRWKSVRRSERRIARAQRHASRRARSSGDSGRSKVRHENSS